MAFWSTKKPSATWVDAAFLAIDLELSGLDVRHDCILSVGWCPIDDSGVPLGQAQHFYFKDGRVKSAAVGIHQITQEMLDAQGVTTEEILSQLSTALKNRTLLFHHAPLDCGFLHKYWQTYFDQPFDYPAIDTLGLERSILQQRHQVIPDQGLRLSACRQRYHLPDYQQHSALTDALATAELFLAQANHLGTGITVAELIKRSGKRMVFA